MGAAFLYLLFLRRVCLRLSIHSANSQNSLNLLLHFCQERRVVLEVHLGILAALTNPLRAIAVPRSRLVDDTRFRRNVQHQRRMADPLGIHNIELSLLERGGNLILYNLHPNMRPDDVLLLLHRGNPADIQAHRSVKLESLSAGGGFRVAEHHTDLLTQLVDEDHRSSRTRDCTGELPQSLAHETRLKTNMRIPHVTFDLSTRHKRSN